MYIQIYLCIIYRFDIPAMRIFTVRTGTFGREPRIVLFSAF